MSRVSHPFYFSRLYMGEPLKMLPMAEDNYGSDACDILYLSSFPPCLVISTVSGTLLHCVILPGPDHDQVILTHCVHI